MSDTSTALQPIDTLQLPAKRKPGGQPRIERPVREAIEVMVTEGLPWDEAAQRVNMRTRTLRLALEKPHVLKYLKTRKQVFREQLSAANPKRLAEIRDNTTNLNAAVRAIAALEGMSEEAARTSGQSVGFQIVVVNGSNGSVTGHVREIDAKPLTDQENDQ